MLDRADFDFLVWLDADVIITNMSHSVAELVDGLERDRRCDLLLAEDAVERANLFNSGVMIVRGGSEAAWAHGFFEWLMAENWAEQQEHNAGWSVSSEEWARLNRSRWSRGPLGCDRSHPALRAPHAARQAAHHTTRRRQARPPPRRRS